MQGQEEQNAFTIIVWDQLFEPSEVFMDVLETATGAIYDVTQNLIASASVNEYVRVHMLLFIASAMEAKFSLSTYFYNAGAFPSLKYTNKSHTSIIVKFHTFACIGLVLRPNPSFSMLLAEKWEATTLKSWEWSWGQGYACIAPHTVINSISWYFHYTSLFVLNAALSSAY